MEKKEAITRVLNIPDLMLKNEKFAWYLGNLINKGKEVDNLNIIKEEQGFYSLSRVNSPCYSGYGSFLTHSDGEISYFVLTPSGYECFTFEIKDKSREEYLMFTKQGENIKINWFKREFDPETKETTITYKREQIFNSINYCIKDSKIELFIPPVEQRDIKVYFIK